MSFQTNNITIEGAQEKFLEGISQVSEVIRKSYGPKGMNVSVEREFYPFHEVVNDAQSIIQSICIDDAVERRGLNFIKELSDKASRDSGEGRKTTIIIAEELLKGGFETKIKGMKLKEELDKLLPEVLENIRKQTKRVELTEIGMVAETSSRSKEIGTIISEIYQKIGREGIIQVEGSGTYETNYEITDGIRFSDSGMLSPYMGDKGRAIYESPIVLVAKKKIEKDADIAPLVDMSIKQGKALVIFTDDIDQNVGVRLIATHRAGVAKILIIKAPVIFKDYAFEDFAKCTGATIVEQGVNFNKLPLEFLGTCDKLITDKEDTVLVGIKDLSEWKDELRKRGDDDSIRRVYQLNTKTAILKLGAGSESELSYKRLKATDAVNACRLALEGGIVEGGGKTLYNVAMNILVTPISNIFINALGSPFRQLMENEEGEMNTEGVWDSSLVIQNAVKNAVSLAGIVLTTGADIQIPEESSEDKQLRILSMQNNRPRL